ncbi:ABC transporter transmembrane region 2-domain-containing protein, partial [Dimargaris cristalligena]
DRARFISKVVLEFGFIMWPLSIVNNSLKLIINALSLRFRTHFTRRTHSEYLNGITFYKMTNLDTRIQNVDQLITQDISKFSESLSHLYSDTVKLLVDIFLFAYKLGQAIGGTAPLAMVGYFFCSAVILRNISPPIGKYTAVEQNLGGQFRYTHLRIITHAEEIAFYGGGERERELVNSSFHHIVQHIKKVYKLRFLNGVFDSVLVKYGATMIAYYILARLAFDPKCAGQVASGAVDPTQIMEDYSRNSRFLTNLSQAMGRLILAGRDITRFAGYTARVSELFTVLNDVSAGKYERSMVEVEAMVTSGTVDTRALGGHVVHQDGVIDFVHVPVVTPNGDILVRDLTFRIDSGMNYLITGPDGCGKSSLFCILGDLWPQFAGSVVKPRPQELFYVPQKPYLPLGTFRDQVIYPHSHADATARGFADDDLVNLLQVVHLEYLVGREGGWNSIRDWGDVLSGGGKQRVAMTRLFYHQPQFAILDECTSAISVDVEGIMYNHAKRVGITLFTVSHRTSLFKYHDFLLRFDDEGGYSFDPLSVDDDETPFSFSHGKSGYAATHSTTEEVTTSSSVGEPDSVSTMSSVKDDGTSSDK